MHIHRQGDVYLQKVEETSVKMQEVKDVTIALGEVSGHHHTVFPIEEKTKLEIARDAEGTTVRVTGGKAALFHGTTEQINQVRSGKVLDWEKQDVHQPQYLEPGVYRMWQQTEYDVNEYRKKVLD